MFSAREVIDIAIRLEKNAEKYYRQALEKTTDPSVASLLNSLADEEAEHAQCLEQLKQSVKISAKHSEMEELCDAVLRNLIGDQKFSLNEVDLSENLLRDHARGPRSVRKTLRPHRPASSLPPLPRTIG